ncbi:MAG: HAMP domain-containing sensor histidine kinase [Acidobacteriaceae bacterium]
MKLPIRTRLSVSYFLIFAFAGTLLVCASWYMGRRSLYFELDHEMDEHIDDVRDFIVANHLGNDEAKTRAALAAEFGLKDEGKWMQIQNRPGHWVYRQRHMMIAPHDLPPPESLPRQGIFMEFEAGPDHVRTLRRSFAADGQVWVVESGVALTKTARILAQFRGGLLLITPLVLLMAGIAGHLISRRALDPVAAIALEAQRIHEGNLHGRLPYLDTHDELAHLSETLNDMLERIESGVRSVRDFTAHASHELRTPVALIRSEAELALRFDRSPREYREAICVIGAEAQQMSSLLDSLLFLARIDAGTEQARLEPVDAQLLCARACTKWRLALREAGVHLTADLPSSPVMVLADSLYLPRLLNVILENAGKYTPSGGCVRLALTMCGDQARFEVRDTGVGIPAEDKSRIFDRFYRAGNARRANVPGSGLGLALASWIAARHGTMIEVVSELGSGSCFRWDLRLATASALRGHDAACEPVPLASIA